MDDLSRSASGSSCRFPLLIRRGIPFLLLILVLAGTRLGAVDYIWKSVPISGAQALVDGVITHPSGLVCIRTDVGGAYRWDRKARRWVSLNDSLPFSLRDDWSCESLAIDPRNPRILYFAGGSYVTHRPGSVFTSADGGTTWKKTGLSVPMGGNMDRRWAGERLAVDPANSLVLLFGSRTTGLWRSIDGGTRWSRIASVPVATDIYGVQTVAFAPISRSGLVYVAVSGHGVYRSLDHGGTFVGIGGDPSPRRLAVAGDGRLWYTHGHGVSCYADGTWSSCTPGLTTGTDVYCGLAIDPAHPQDILVGRSECFAGNENIYHSTDGGATWKALASSHASTTPWFSNWGSMWTCALAFDPLDRDAVWCGLWRTGHVSSPTVAWLQQEVGHEEDVVATLIAPPGGPHELLTGSWDNDGFAVRDPAVCPRKPLGIIGSWNGHTWGMAYERKDPRNMLRIGAQTYDGGATVNVASSQDGGTTWRRLPFPSGLFPAICAVSATDARNLVVICSAIHSSDPSGQSWPKSVPAADPWRCSTDGGTTWKAITGLPMPPKYRGQSSFHPSLAADGARGGTFYYYDHTAKVSRLYVSSDGGLSFPSFYAAPPGASWMSRWQLKTRPDVAGDIWLCMDHDSEDWTSGQRDPLVEGLYHSPDGGKTWTKLANVSRAWSFGFGLPTRPGGSATIFLYGRLHGSLTDSLYRSLDLGRSWEDILAPGNRLSDYPNEIEGSWKTIGRVFVGTGGRGVIYGSVAASP